MRYTFQFKSPSSILVAGPSQSGKSTFTRKLLLENTHLFEKSPKKCAYCYGAYQPEFELLKNKNIHLHEGLPEEAQLNDWFQDKDGSYPGGVLVLDDLMSSGSKDEDTVKIFTQYSHHRNIICLYLCQSLFPPGRHARTISLNCHYAIVFKNPRDQVSLKNLLLQPYPKDWPAVLNVYNDLMNRKNYAYMILDFHPRSNDKIRIVADVLKDEGRTTGFELPPVNSE